MFENLLSGLEQYDVKILAALTKSIAGRKDFFHWLLQGGYPELAAFSNAIRGDEEAMVWLFQHDCAWLAILSNAIDGEVEARQWMARACTPVNLVFALACREDATALRWLQERKLFIFMLMAREVHQVLDTQAVENAGPYTRKFGGNVRVVEAMQQWMRDNNINNGREERD
ncbi:MAG: hypothetical protein AUK63_544 [bacterium P3]|nr:MAG: hypothetical protein AUK63_544 [bacterium P3]KWW42000.1 MAG: hypothetical protein F083_651 [bacterium F083]